ncbi:hypothetical protein J0S82_017270 [Galemys pyrenaicus]|uniref:Transmembrane protein n=1 Tax=Galemys pyrenaicus TaxID=202257 RepID=A0A8J6DRM3_GALPY|nr:hypothetical protein J0S82_017270 [Galemys pyrenaicus]
MGGVMRTPELRGPTDRTARTNRENQQQQRQREKQQLRGPLAPQHIFTLLSLSSLSGCLLLFASAGVLVTLPLYMHVSAQVAITKAKVDFSSVVCLPPSVIAVNGLDGGGAGENDDEPVLVSLSAAPSPQSEAVANELQELSLQPELTLGLHPGRNPNLPPLSERKNGK